MKLLSVVTGTRRLGVEVPFVPTFNQKKCDRPALKLESQTICEIITALLSSSVSQFPNSIQQTIQHNPTKFGISLATSDQEPKYFFYKNKVICTMQGALLGLGMVSLSTRVTSDNSKNQERMVDCADWKYGFL